MKFNSFLKYKKYFFIAWSLNLLFLISCHQVKQFNPPMKTHNRLINEKSPYLLQHADNPVDWYAWGEEAFKKSAQENKPIFLSIGYSTCHWCHVMAHESFENADVAAMINEYFIPVKVDREERPDIDSTYMSAVQSMTGQGGWPLTVFLTSDLKPFYGGTYFPPFAKWGTPGLTDVLQSIHHMWQTNPQKIIESSENITQALAERHQSPREKRDLNPHIFQASYQEFASSFDAHFGGFGHAPKFPSCHNLSFLLRNYQKTKQPDILHMVEDTLKHMAKGGMFDQLGGGFHRYSTDEKWHIPHFEKMLYDQAIAVQTYLEAYQLTHDEFYADIARQTLDYVLTDLQADEGGFFSAEDADSYDPQEYAQKQSDPSLYIEKKEGSFYLFSFQETQKLFGEKIAEVVNYHFGILPDGNASVDPHGEFINKNILYLAHDIKQTAEHFKISVEDVTKMIQEAKEQMLQMRNTRPRSHLDDKILVDWNGLMISSFALAYRVLKDDRYQVAAVKAADWLLANLKDKNGQLLHRYRDHHAGIMATLDDYAFLINGLIGVYEATFDSKYLKESVRLTDEMINLFWDNEQGGFFMTAEDQPAILFKQKEVYDGATPSGNSMAALCLTKVYHLTLKEDYQKKRDELFRIFASDIRARPSAYSQMLIAYDYAVGPSLEAVFSVGVNKEGLELLIDAFYEYPAMKRVVLLNDESSKTKSEFYALAPFLESQPAMDGKPTVYICENHQCQFPVVEVQKLRDNLNQIFK